MADRLGIDWTADLADVIADLPTTIVIGSQVLTCAANEERRTVDVEDGGRYVVFERQATLPLSLVKTVPAVQSFVVLDSVRYHVADIVRQRETDTLQLTIRREDGN